MNYKRWLVVMFACLGLATGFYLVGCGDDDDDGISCSEAISEFLGDDCQTQSDAAAAALDACVDLCDAEDEDCNNACLDDFIEASPACSEAVDKLFDSGDCGICVMVAGDAFYECITLELASASDCLDTLSDAIDVCEDLPL